MPRQEFQLVHQLTPDEFGKSRQLAKAIGGDECYLPVWPEMSEIGSISAHTVNLAIDATNTCYRNGGKLLVWDDSDNCEVCTINTVGSGTISLTPWVVNAYSNALVAPIRLARFAQEYEAGRQAIASMVETQARFSVVETEDLSGETGIVYPTFYDHPVVTDAPRVLSGSVSEQFEREVDTLDSRSGIVWKAPAYEQAYQSSALASYDEGLANVWKRRVWLHTRKGRWKAFWAPSWNDELPVSQPITEDDETLVISAMDYATYYPIDAAVTWVLFTTAGVAHCFRVYNRVVVGDEEVLSVTPAFTASIALNQIDKVCRLVLSRYDADRIEIQHRVASSATISTPTVEVPFEVPS
jgi:hypothetical protein